MSYRIKFINKIFWSIIFLWTILILSFAIITVFENYNYADALALSEAKTSVKKDLAYRMWAASHGGVYVPVTKRTQPNPYLKHVPSRDIKIPDGRYLTLMNPAFMLSQITQEYSKLYGIKGHITSKILLNPANKPDEWEFNALNIIEQTRKPTYEKTMVDGEINYRYIHPLITQKACLKCHAFQEYEVGDVRGGLAVSIPMKGYYDTVFRQSIVDIIFALFIWIFGSSLIIFGRKKAKEILLEKIKSYEQNIYSLVTMIEKRDRFTAGHAQRVAHYASLIARQMNYDEDTIAELNTACILHDIGKISTPDSILLKPGILTDEERQIIQEHVVVGYEILKDIDIYRDIAEIMRHHHEHYDGSGYPQKLKGDEIPQLSQIMAIADTFDAMTTDRIYKEKIPVQVALGKLKSLSGKLFDAGLIDETVLALQDVEIEHILTQAPLNSLERARFSYFYKDQVVDAYNRDYLIYFINRINIDEYQYKFAYIIYLHNVNEYNRDNGWIVGNALFDSFTKEIDKTIENKLLFRVYGDNFIILTKEKIEFDLLRNQYRIFLQDKNITLSMQEINMQEHNIKTFKEFENCINL